MPRPDDSITAYIHPRFWLNWLGLAALRCIHLLPFRFQLAIGRLLGSLAYRLAHRRVHIARVNINLCFPENSLEENERIVLEHFKAFGMGFFESSMSWWGSNEAICAMGKVNGIEHLQKAMEQKRGAILLTGHFTSMELAGHILSANLRIGAMYRPMKNKLMDHVIAMARRRRLDPVFERSETRSMIRSLKQGAAIWYGFDQNYGMKHGVFAKFFGNPAATITTTSRFAKLGNALVIPFFPIRKADGNYDITILPALNDFPSDDVEQDTQRLNDLLEAQIKKCPEQYLWTHRRFKTRPKGLASVYE